MRKILGGHTWHLCEDRGAMTIHEVKKSLGRRVSYNGSDCYELTGCIIRKSSKTGQFFYQAEIADKTCGNTLVYCRLEELRCENETH